MMIARIVTLSKKSLPSHQLQHRLTAGSITVTCDDVYTAQLNQNDDDAKVISQQQFAHLCHIGSTVTDTKRHGGPDMLGVYK